MQPRFDLPPLIYQRNLPIHEGFILAAEEQLTSDAVNICAMMERPEREFSIQAVLVVKVQDCLEKAHDVQSDSVKKDVQGKSDLEGGERIDVGQQILVNVGRRGIRDRCTCCSPHHPNS
jgi:hypothetical protein